MSGPSGWKHDYDILRSIPTEFRLVTIHPGVRPNVIESSITTHALSDHPPYEALSYVWGGFGEDPYPINLDGFRFEVTANLFTAMYYLRREHESRTFWIDSICIDQDDPDERSSQVQLMRDIYKCARRVVVWLGDETYWSNRLFVFLRSMDKARGWVPGNEDSEKAFRRSRAELQKTLSTDQDVRRIVERGLYGDLAQCPFWSRIWIVQEVAVAPDVLVQCGTDEVSWVDFSNAVWVLHEVSFLASAVDDPELGGLPNLETISIIREILSLQSTLSLSDVLACLRRSRATDPRDMVYGLLGLLPKPTMQPDYSNATTRDVYIALVDQCINVEKSLDIITLSRRSHSSTTAHLPSWVPDWTESYERGSWEDKPLMNNDFPAYPLVLKYVGGEHLRSLTLVDDPEPALNEEGTPRILAAWSAHGGHPPIATIQRISPEVTSLTARGIAVGTITELGGFTNYDEDDDGRLFFFDVLSNWEEIMLRKFGLCENVLPGKTMLDVFDQCLEILDQYLSSTGVDFAAERAFKFQKREQQRLERKEKYGEITSCSEVGERSTVYGSKCSMVEAFLRTILADLDADLQRLPPSFFPNFFPPTNTTTPNPSPSPFLPFATNRRLFITSSGYIGLAPIKACVGDHVCVLYGCSVPVVLRAASKRNGEDDKEDGVFSFVGEAYGHGLMDGEAVRMVDVAEGVFREREWIIF